MTKLGLFIILVACLGFLKPTSGERFIIFSFAIINFVVIRMYEFLYDNEFGARG